MTILYINDEHCSSVEQLKEYFKTGMNYDSPIRMELLDYGRAGDISDWLREKGESELADSVGIAISLVTMSTSRNSQPYLQAKECQQKSRSFISASM